MSKFKVGDKIRFVEDFGSYKKGDVVEVVNKNVYHGEQTVDFTGKNGNGNTYITRVELVTKKQRITSLEERVEQQQNEINDLKVIVHQLRENGLPSTIQSVEDESEIIEFEGAKYRKVARKAQAGDVVVLRDTGGNLFKVGSAYKVVEGVQMADKYGDLWDVYRDEVGRTQQTVDVYELIVEDKQFPPSDVFNEHIGKAIALGRALSLDVSEFENAVQPTDVVIGMYISTKGYGVKKVVYTDEEVDNNENSCCLSRRTADLLTALNEADEWARDVISELEQVDRICSQYKDEEDVGALQQTIDEVQSLISNALSRLQ